jgi:hypothetical protein
MGKKGRRGSSKKWKGEAFRASAAPAPLDEQRAVHPSDSAPPHPAKPEPPAAAAPSEAAAQSAPSPAAPAPPAAAVPGEADVQRAAARAEPMPPEVAPPIGAVDLAAALETSSPAPEAQPEREAPRPVAESSAHAVRDLDASFFAEGASEAWLTHELELRDPQLLRKMTDNVARRRAHLARYVVGVVGVAVALCLAALIKSAVPAGDDDARAHPAAPMPMPASRPVPLPSDAPAAPAENIENADGGG